MLKKLTLNKNKKGFTLIELMIVIAIIGILAAIAVPQFTAYRLRAFNSSGKAIAHNLKADQANLYSETAQYGQLSSGEVNLKTLVTPGAADTTTNTSLAVPATAAKAGGALGNSRLTIAIALGKDMNAQCNVDAARQSHTTFARHYKGDTAYSVDSDIESVLYTVSNPTWPSTTGVKATTIASTQATDDIVGKSGGGTPGISWSAAN